MLSLTNRFHVAVRLNRSQMASKDMVRTITSLTHKPLGGFVTVVLEYYILKSSEEITETWNLFVLDNKETKTKY